MTSLHMQAFNITILGSIAFSLDVRVVHVFVFHCNLSAFACLLQHSRIRALRMRNFFGREVHRPLVSFVEESIQTKTKN